MASAQDAVPLIVVMVALLCLPPIVSLVASLRRIASLRRSGGNTSWPLAGAVVSAAAILFNVTVIAVTAWAMREGDLVLGGGHAVAAFLAWLCVWIWVALMLFGRRRHRNIR